jgi:hypothetical protein
MRRPRMSFFHRLRQRSWRLANSFSSAASSLSMMACESRRSAGIEKVEVMGAYLDELVCLVGGHDDTRDDGVGPSLAELETGLRCEDSA